MTTRRSQTLRLATFLTPLAVLIILVVPAFTAGCSALSAPPVVPQAAGAGRVQLNHGSHPAILAHPVPGDPIAANTSAIASTNWSGYAIMSGTGSVTDVNGSWIVPSVLCSTSVSFSAFWVGIDGLNDNTVEQIGTESDCLGRAPIYYAWYEFYPEDSVLIGSVPVTPGDVIWASVSCSTVLDQCTVSITDVTSGQAYSFTEIFGASFTAQLSSGEWIAEAPSSSTSGSELPLADFEAVHFGEDASGVSGTNFATVNGVTGPIGSFGADVVEVTMESQGGSVLAQPSGLSPDGSSFSVAWGSGQVPAIPVLTAGAATPFGPTIKEGDQVMLTAEPSGGLPPYSVDWYASSTEGNCFATGTPVAKGATYTVSPTTSTYYCYEVTDSETPQAAAGSPPDLVTVLTFLGSPAIEVSPGIIGVGQSALISTITPFSGGASPNVCQWLERSPTSANFIDLGEPFTSGCTASSQPSVSSGALSAPGTWAFELQVKDAAGNTTASPPATLSVSALVGPALSVSCAPNPIEIGLATTCEASVQGSGSEPPTGSVVWASATPGAFSHASCKLSKDTGACSVKFTPTSAGPSVGLLATYGGDSANSPASTAYVLNVTAALTKVAVSCTPKSVPAGSQKTITCSAKVSGRSPTGTLVWTQTGGGLVSFQNSSCTLSKVGCSVTLSPSLPGDVGILASYSGDPNNAASSGGETLTVGRESTQTTVTCSSSTLGDGAQVRCRATVSGLSPTGTVSWSETSGSGSITISASTCTLSSSGTCSVLITGTGIGNVKVKASYGGDADNEASSETFGMKVTAA